MQASEDRQKRKQKRKADEGQLAMRRQEMDKAKVSFLSSSSSCFKSLAPCSLRK